MVPRTKVEVKEIKMKRWYSFSLDRQDYSFLWHPCVLLRAACAEDFLPSRCAPKYIYEARA